MKSESPFSPGDSICGYFRDSGGEEQDLSIDQQMAVFDHWCGENDLIPGNLFADRARPGSSTVGRD